MPELPWLASPQGAAGAGGYEDWYVLEDWAALGVLKEAAVSRGHVSAHDKVASLSGVSTGAVYRFLEGHAGLDEGSVAVWVARPSGHEHPSLSALLGDGMDPAVTGYGAAVSGSAPHRSSVCSPPRPQRASRRRGCRRAGRATVLAREALWRG